MSILTNINPLSLYDIFNLQLSTSNLRNDNMEVELLEQILQLPYDKNLDTNLIHLCATWWIEKGRFSRLSYLDKVNDEKSYYFLKISMLKFDKRLWYFTPSIPYSNLDIPIMHIFWSCKNENMSDTVPFLSTSIKILCNGNNRIII